MNFTFQKIVRVKCFGKIQSYKIVPERFSVIFVIYHIIEENLKFGQTWPESGAGNNFSTPSPILKQKTLLKSSGKSKLLRHSPLCFPLCVKTILLLESKFPSRSSFAQEFILVKAVLYLRDMRNQLVNTIHQPILVPESLRKANFRSVSHSKLRSWEIF